TGECVTWDVSTLSASSSVRTLGILAALAAPLHRPGIEAGAPRAILYVDVRDPRKHVERSHVEFFLSAALLVGALLDQRARGESDDLNTITSELFGHERGAFSGAASKRVGLVEFADGGTLILDEILNLAPHAQKLLLDFTQFGTYRPLGYDRPAPKQSRVRI